MELYKLGSLWNRKQRAEQNDNIAKISQFMKRFDGSRLVEESYNLANPSDFVEGVLSRGELAPNSLFYTTGFIRVSPGDPLFVQVDGDNKTHSFYSAPDESTYISGNTSMVEQPVTVPAGAHYVRGSVRKDDSNRFMIYISNTPKKYKAPGFSISPLLFDQGFLNELEELRNDLNSSHLEMYNVADNTEGEYISFANGQTQSNSGWAVTAHIFLKPDTLYLKNRRGQHAYFKGGYEHLGGAGNATSNMLFRTPKEISSARFSVPINEQHDFKLINLSEMKDSSVKPIFAELHNPFKRSYIKMIGDSNVAGSGGTGYKVSDSSADPAPGMSGRYMNENGYCWANEVRDLLVEKFNGKAMTNLHHESVKVLQRNPTANRNKSAPSSFNVNLTEYTPLEFECYGSEFTLHSLSASANIKVYEDDVLKTTLNMSNTTNKINFDNSGKHVIRLEPTGDVTITGLELQKITIAKNYGVSGAGTTYVLDNITGLLDGDESIVMCLVGSNDRIPNSSSDDVYELENNLKLIYLSILDRGANPVLLSSTPASISNEVDIQRDFDKGDVDSAAMAAASTFGYEHIDVYNYILEYCELTGTSIDSLLADGVHPNDEGYRLAFNYISRKIGVGRKRPDATW